MAMLEMQQCTIEGCDNPALINRMGPISRKQNGRRQNLPAML